jgi:glycosyltransferase involved in cell wall biosynthesis
MTLVSHSETFSIAALEAMALGKPMVMSDTGGAGELVAPGEQGFLFRPGDVATLAEHLRSLASPALRARLGAAAAHRVRERFTVDAMAAHFTDRIEMLLGRRASRLSGSGTGAAPTGF